MTEPKVERHAPYTAVHSGVRRFLEPIQDVLVVLLAGCLFALMARNLYLLARDVFAPALAFRAVDVGVERGVVRAVVAEVLFVFVLIELTRLLILYLREHHVAVDVMVGVTVVSVLREVILIGIVELEPLRTAAIAVFLLALGLLLRIGSSSQL